MNVTSHEQEVSVLFRLEVDKQELNQKEMAEDLKVSPQLLSHMLNGRRAIGFDRVITIADYLQDPDLDFKVAAAMFHTPKPLRRQRRDDHPLSKMVGQDKEEMERIELEKKYEIWDLLSISNEDISGKEREEIVFWLVELIDEISAEIAVLNSVCSRYGFNSREIISQSESKERND